MTCRIQMLECARIFLFHTSLLQVNKQFLEATKYAVMQQCSNTNITHSVFVLVFTCLKGRFEINYLNAFVKILKLP